MQPETSAPLTNKGDLPAEHGFEYENRPVRDIVWTVLFVLLALLTCGLGIYAGVNKMDDASVLFHKDYHTDPGYCSDVNASGIRPQLQSVNVTIPHTNGFLEFLDHGWIWILIATIAAVVLGFIFVLLFSYFAAFMVYFVAAILALVPLGCGLINLLAYDDAWGWAYIAVGVIIGIVLLFFHSQLRLTAKLLDLGADGLRDNLDLVPFSILANLILLALLTGLFCFGVLALTNGKFVPNDRLDLTQFPEECVSRRFGVGFGGPIDCCDYDLDSWVVGYWVLILIMMIWTVFLLSQIRVYVVAGVVAQWYFADESNRGNMSITKSLGNAMGSSFGSLVLSSMILTIANIVRRLSEYITKRAQDENARCKWLITCIACLIQTIAHIIEWVTDFATVRMAITGESFFTAGRNVIKMMTDNLINAYAIWWFPPLVLYILSFLISISASTVLALAARNTWNDEDDLVDVRKWSWYIFIICFFLTAVVLYFFSTLLIDAVNTIFVCFAIDKANKTEKNTKAHEVFASIPGMGAPIAAAVAQVTTRGIDIETNPPMPADPPRVD